MHWGVFGVFLYGFLVTSSVYADADGERSALARLDHELAAVQPLIEEAKAQANPDARIQFQYPWLTQDLAHIRLGIQAHLNAPRAEPRTFKPLRGDYRR